MKRLVLARDLQHPLADAVRCAGWEPMPFFCTHMEATEDVPPEDPECMDAIMVLSPTGARAACPHLPEGSLCIATGQGTAAILEDAGMRVETPEEPHAESLWAMLQARFPSGGSFLLVRGERSRALLESTSAGTAWELHPWITHREKPIHPLPNLPPCEAMLALSPIQAETLCQLSRTIPRLAWGASCASAFTEVGYPAKAICEPRPDELIRLLVSLD